MNFPINKRQQKVWNPWSGFEDLSKEMERIFGSGLDFPSAKGSGFDFSPTCDIKETDKEYKFQFDLPGVKKEDINLELDGNRLTVSGQRHLERGDDKDKTHLRESYHGSYMRSFTLPSEIDLETVSADYTDGVLKVSVPKSNGRSTRKVDVR